MTRYAQGHKSESKRHIVRAASRLFRRDGSGGTGIAAIMKAANLTHGGFYAHFSSKEQLLHHAIVAAVEESRAGHKSATAAVPVERRFSTVVDRYLSANHRDHASDGCALAALASDMPRHPTTTRTAFTRGVRGMLAMLDDLVVADVPNERLLGVLSTMVGALQLARAVDEPELSDEFLAAGRDAALRLIGEAGSISG